MGAVKVYDDFNRADNASSMGTATSGQTWAAASGTCGINSNQAYTASGGNNEWVLDSGLADFDLFATLAAIPASGTAGGVMFRYTASFLGYYFKADVTAGDWLLEKYDGASTILRGGSAPAAGDKIHIRCVGNSITCLVNNTIAVTRTDSYQNTATKHGVTFASTTTRVDNFSIRYQDGDSIVHNSTALVRASRW